MPDRPNDIPPLDHDIDDLPVPDVAGRMPLEDQVAEFNARVEYALDRAAFQLTEPGYRRVLARTARGRLVKGIADFGDAGWRKHPDELMTETIEELADAVVYLVMRDYARRGGPGGR